MRRNQVVLKITEEQRSELSKWAASRTLPAGECVSSAVDPGVGGRADLPADQDHATDHGANNLALEAAV